MKNIIAQVLTEQATESLPVISLEQEVHHIEHAEDARCEIVSEMGDSARTLNLITALENLAIVADTIRQPTEQEAALIQIAGDTALAGTGLSGGEITPSMEDIGDGPSVSVKVRSAIEQILRALKELLVRIAKMVRTYVQHARAAAGGHVQRQKVIKERLMAASTSLNSETEITMSMPVADGKTLTSLSDIVNEAVKFSVVIDWFVKSSTSFNIDYASGFVDLYAKIGDGDKGISVVEQFSILNKIADQTGHIGNVVPHGHVADEKSLDYYELKTNQTTQLLGGISLSVTSAKPINHNAGLSSASIKHAVEELTKVGFKVESETGGFYKESFLTKPLNQAELHKAFDTAAYLIEHFTAKSDHTALAAATARRSEFAETAVDHLTRYTEKFKKNDVAAKEYGSAALRIGQSVLTNATVPYTQLTTAVSRVINLLQSAMLKSLNAHEHADGGKEHTPGKATPSNEAHEDLVYSAEGLLSGLVDFVLGRKKPKKKGEPEPQKPQNSWHEYDLMYEWINRNVLSGNLVGQATASNKPFTISKTLGSFLWQGEKQMTTVDSFIAAVHHDAGVYSGLLNKIRTPWVKANTLMASFDAQATAMAHAHHSAGSADYDEVKALIMKYAGKLPPKLTTMISNPSGTFLGDYETTPFIDDDGKFVGEQGGVPRGSVDFEAVDETGLKKLLDLVKKIGPITHELFELTSVMRMGFDQTDPPFRAHSGDFDRETLDALDAYSHPEYDDHYRDIMNALWARMENLEFTIWTVIRSAVSE